MLKKKIADNIKQIRSNRGITSAQSGEEAGFLNSVTGINT